jgi:hypothetical protein
MIGAMRAPLLRVSALAAVACVVSAVGPAFGAPGRTLAGVTCETPPPVHCTLDGCTREQLGNLGNAKEPKSGRSFFLDYPCDLKPGEPVVFSEPARRRIDRQLAAALLPCSRLQGQVPPRHRDAHRRHDRTITPGAPGVRMWNADADDAFLRDLVDYLFAEIGRPSSRPSGSWATRRAA